MPTVYRTPGEKKVLTIQINGTTMKEFNLLPLRERQVRLTGLTFFTDAEGHRQVSEIDEVKIHPIEAAADAEAGNAHEGDSSEEPEPPSST